MSLDHCVLPFEDESGLYGLLILTQFLHKSPSLRDTGMKCGVEPLISFFASTMSQHLGIMLEQRIEMPHLGMELANLALSQAFFFRELARAMEHQSHGSRWPQDPGETVQSSCVSQEIRELAIRGTSPSHCARLLPNGFARRFRRESEYLGWLVVLSVLQRSLLWLRGQTPLHDLG